MKRDGLLVVMFVGLLLALGASDEGRMDPRQPVARIECARVSWATGAGHAAQTTTARINGIVYRIDIILSAVTANPTVNVSYADQNAVVCLPAMNTLADGTAHFKNALVNSISTSADFNPVAINGTITVTIDPSADAGGSAQTLTADVIFYVR
jgi:hypothetical protein